MYGVRLYVGTNGTGKTTHALEDLRRTGLRRVVMDCGASQAVAPILSRPLCDAGLVDELRISIASSEELARALEHCWRRGNLALLLDDVGGHRGPWLDQACRLWRARNLRLFMTTHHIAADLGQVVLACNPLVCAYRTTSPRSLEFLHRQFGLDPSVIRALPKGECMEASF